MNLFDDLGEICTRDAPLAPLTWFRLGGPAQYLISPRNEEELSTVIKRCRETGLPVRFLGLGANLIVADEGVCGAVIRLDAEAFSRTAFAGKCVVAGAGVDMTKLVLATVRRGLAGLEVLAGIPGTVGGGVAMNCGGRYGEIAVSVKSVRVVGSDGAVYERQKEDLHFGYRRCALGDDCISTVVFGLNETEPKDLELRFREIWMYKQNTQPPLGVQSVGCIFRNPDRQSAGELIDRAGLKGTRLGSAYVSDRHANFILADPGGRAADVIGLIALIKERVKDHCGVALEPEVKIW